MRTQSAYVCRKDEGVFSYLICKERYYFRFDSSAVCAKCGAHIRTPKLYRKPLLLVIYGIAVFLITIGVWLPLVRLSANIVLLFGLYALAWLLFERVFVATIFTFGKWPTDEDVGNCSTKDAFWGKRRVLTGMLCANCALFLMKILM
jgi:hypothetical protein